MRRETVVIGVLVAVVLLPMWYVALHGEPASEEIAIDGSVSEIRPLDGPVDAPNKLSPSQVGVIVWVALFGLYGLLVGAHRFMNTAVRPSDADAAVAVSDGGYAETDDADRDAEASDTRPDGGRTRLSWLQTDERWLVEYHGATGSDEGLVVMAALTILAIAFAALFTGEYFTLARTQYFGLYAAGLFISLAALTVAYYAWFMPHVEVAEKRDH
ncbi:hypothetical protein ACFQMA_08400 [Halosimplex aquaticum]|uniref:Uncharacterized protein n=1 Tax=Halosimplex aquaticum TaxID=3026162 RepID=A0ABD5XXK8_9EURY|nr:hypothetical protein [Halosimplex aquaticum]